MLIGSKDRTRIDFGLAGVSSLNFDDLYLTVNVDGEEVARMLLAIMMAYDDIILSSAGVSILPGVLGGTYPVRYHTQQDRANHDREQPPNHEQEKPNTSGCAWPCVSLQLWFPFRRRKSRMLLGVS